MKLCKICGQEIFGKSRKYCKDCRRDVHLLQMNDYYAKNTKNWQYGGKYYKNRNPQQLLGTAGLGEHRINDDEKEYEQIQKELKNLKLRKRDKYWRA